jgi:hypothetical protein
MGGAPLSSGATGSGACCFPEGECETTSQIRYSASDGAYYGNGMPCLPVPSLPVPTEEKSWGRIKSPSLQVDDEDPPARKWTADHAVGRR